MPRQFVNPAPVLHDILGIDPAFNGSLTFYGIGTTTLKDTWADYDQSILNENPVPLDSAARSNTQIWGEGEYTIVLRNEHGEIVWTRDWRPEQTGSDTLPEKEAGKFLTTDGESWLLDEIRQTPDPTGFAGRILSTDGANLLWVTPGSVMPEPPEPVEPDVEIGTSSITIGDGGATKWKLQTGTGTINPTGQQRASATVEFPEAFTGTPWFVGVEATTNAVNASNWQVVTAVTTKAAAGFTVWANTNAGAEGGGGITASVPFDWVAIGPVQ